VIERLAEAIRSSKCVVVLTGAGVSTASGIPDFRGPQGLWKRVDPGKFEISYFHLNPDEVWSLMFETLGSLMSAEPNPAHYALAELESMGHLCGIITQNVDGLHQKAGSKNVVEIHGNIGRTTCLSCGASYETRTIEFRGVAPRCPSCGGLLKPDVVFFGEMVRDFDKALELAMRADLFIAVGTSLYVSPANHLPIVAKRRGALLAIINQEPTALDDLADIIIRGRAEEVLPKLVNAIRSSERPGKA